MNFDIQDTRRFGSQAFQALQYVVVGLIAILTATWLPHYLTWPLWPDAHAYASLAIGWDQGIEPYRDVATFNFPGQIYLFWILGKIFGWGVTWPFYAADAALIAIVGAFMIVWSRRVFGERLSGLIGLLALAVVLLDLDISQAGQRDWHSTAFVMISLMVLQCGQSRFRFVWSAVFFAAGFVFRPHVVLFGPAIIAAIALEKYDPKQRALKPFVSTCILWGFVFAACLVAGFLPLISHGLFGAFLDDLKIARHGGSYAAMTLKTALVLFLAKFVMREYLLMIVATLTLAFRSGRNSTRVVLPWTVALIFALAYQSVHPISHDYLMLPMKTIYAVNLAILAALVRESLGRETLQAAGISAAVVLLAMNKWPDECSPQAALRSTRAFLTGSGDVDVPHGARRYFQPGEVDVSERRSGYPWADYVATIEYLKAKTTPHTYVAGAFKRMPFPSLNGPTGRPSPWPGEGGTTFLLVLGLEKEERFIKALLNAPEDTVVVWVPGERAEADRVNFERLDRTIAENFAPEASFGIFQIYRRIPAGKKNP
ncbi:hypothetical protein GC170_03335 [bacterium]|nr:hypothetical protein [bacterium]